MISQKYQPPKPVSPSHIEFLGKIGDKLETLREERNLTISFLETELGISRNSYSLMERGLIYFTTSTLFKILDYYKLPPEDFFRELWNFAFSVRNSYINADDTLAGTIITAFFAKIFNILANSLLKVLIYNWIVNLIGIINSHYIKVKSRFNGIIEHINSMYSLQRSQYLYKTKSLWLIHPRFHLRTVSVCHTCLHFFER